MVPLPPSNARGLGDGLVLRRATPLDADALAAFNVRIHEDVGLGPWTRHLMGGRCPFCSAGDFTLVEDTCRGVVVSTLALFNQTWAFDGMEVPVGQVELVGTDPAYRRRGLVRAQMDRVHAWSEERGHLLQTIEGIPFYYRQFGYEMCVDLRAGRQGHPGQVAPLGAGVEEPFRARPAGEEDLPLVSRLYAQSSGRLLLSFPRSGERWRYELAGRVAGDPGRREVRVLESAAGEPVGLLIHDARIDWGAMSACVYELEPGASWLAVTPSVLRHLRSRAEECARRDGADLPLLRLALGAEHPCYAVLPAGLAQPAKPYAWYLRVPDLPRFLRHVAPVLEARLSRSSASGHTGELRLSRYRDGLHLHFRKGRLTEVSALDPEGSADAAFPGLTFLQILFGYRALDELRYAFPDCWASDEAAVLLNALFPKRPSNVWAV